MPHTDGDAKPSAEVTHLFQNRFKVGEAHGAAVALMHFLDSCFQFRALRFRLPATIVDDVFDRMLVS